MGTRVSWWRAWALTGPCAQRRIPLRSRVGAQLRDPMIRILLAAVALTVATGDHADAVVIALVIVANTAVGGTAHQGVRTRSNSLDRVMVDSWACGALGRWG